MLINMQLSAYAKFLDTDSDNLSGGDRIKALMRTVEMPEKLRKASAALCKTFAHIAIWCELLWKLGLDLIYSKRSTWHDFPPWIDSEA